MSDIERKLDEIKQIQADIKKTGEDISVVLTKIGKAERVLALEKRKGTPDVSSEVLPNLTQLHEELATKRGSINEKKQALQQKRIALFARNEPEDIIKQCSNKVPFLMFPVRLETKYMYVNTVHPELWVRIYPDDIAVDTHEESFTEEEIERAVFYFGEVQKAKSDEDRIKTELEAVVQEKCNLILEMGEEPFLSDNDTDSLIALGFTPDDIDAGKKYWQECKRIRDEVRIPAWINMVDSFGPFRSAYIVSKGEDYFTGDEIPLKPESWSRAPQSHIMPDYFVIRLYRKKTVDGILTHELWREERGNPIKYPLAVGPEPLLEGEDPNQLFFDRDSQWMIDFDKSIEAGMGLKIDLSDLLVEGDIHQGFSRVIAIGIKTPASEQGDAQTLCDLFRHHHYAGGFSFLRNGIPTNNTAETESEYNSSEENFEDSYKLEVLNKHFPEEMAEIDANKIKDGFRFARVLSLTKNIEIFDHIAGADETDDQDAKQMAIALWPVTWGTYLSVDLFDKLVYGIDIEELRNHFINYVRACGPYPAIRIDEMPYGILPVSALSLWQEDSSNAKRDFYQGLRDLLYNLSVYWLTLAEDADNIPMIGASDDPDNELIRILGMQDSSYSFRMRSIISENYLLDLLKFVWPSLFKVESLWTRIKNLLPWVNNSGSGSDGETNGFSSYEVFRDNYFKVKEESRQLFRQMTNCTPNIPILDTTTWGDGYDLNIPLVQESPVSESSPLINNYIETLYNSSRGNIQSNTYEGDDPPQTLLFILLRQAVLSSNVDWGNNDEPLRKSFEYLQGLPSAKLEQLVSEVPCLSASRLDAWITSLFTRRLEKFRSRDDANVIYIGVYGWLENLKPQDDKTSGGYIHAPSISHGVTAAVLRNAYLTHADSDNAERMSVNLSSERVKKALWFIEGIRQGQSLNVLLGYRFERLLHETHKEGNTILYLDQYISPLRELYPLDAGKVTEIAEDEAVETLAPSNVVDGLALLKAYRGETNLSPIPFDTNEDLPDTGSAEQKAILLELEDLDETFDAISDLLLSESTHRAVLSDYLGSGAVLDSTSADGSPPDEFLVSKTPRGGVNIKHHCMVMLRASSGDFRDEAECFLNKWPTTKRSAISPLLNAWAAKILGDPEKIVCHAEYVHNNVIERRKVNLIEVINPEPDAANSPLGISPLDFIYLSASLLKEESTALEEIMVYAIKKGRSLDKNCEINFSFERDDHFADDERSFPQVMPLARAMLKLITSTSYLKPQDLYLPEETEVGDVETAETDFTGFSVEDFSWIRDQIEKEEYSGIYIELKTLYNSLLGATEPSDVNQMRQFMGQAIQYGFLGAVPHSASETDETSRIELAEQALTVLKEIYSRLVSCKEHLREADRINNSVTDDDSIDTKYEKRANAIDQLIQCFKAILGKSFVFIPRFTAVNSQELLLSFSHADTLLDGEDERWPLMWFQQAAHTHPNLRHLESLMMLAEIENNQFLELSIAQLPYKENDRWIALPWKDGMDREAKDMVQGTLSIVGYSPFVIDYSKEIAGIVLDKWDEIIPSEEETTSLVYQYNRPSSEAPNCCLLCVSPVLHTEDNKWLWEHLVKCVEETMDMVKIRSVDVDALKKLGRYLPAIYMRGKVQRSDQTLRFPLSIMREE